MAVPAVFVHGQDAHATSLSPKGAIFVVGWGMAVPAMFVLGQDAHATSLSPKGAK